MQLNGILIKDLNVVLVTTSFQRVWLGDEKLPTNTKVTIPVDRLSDLHFKTNRIQLLGYTNGVEQISPEEFSSRQSKILNGNDYEDLDLDGRYAYDKFFETYKQVFGQEVEERTPVEVNIVQVQINGMGAEREATLLGKVERQSAALKLAREALFDMQDSYAAVHGWKDSFEDVRVWSALRHQKLDPA